MWNPVVSSLHTLFHQFSWLKEVGIIMYFSESLGYREIN